MATVSSTSRSARALERLIASELWVLCLQPVLYFAAVRPFAPRLGLPPKPPQRPLRTCCRCWSSPSGQTFVLIAGGIDLSATSVIALRASRRASVMTADGGLRPAGGGDRVAAVMVRPGSPSAPSTGLAVTRLRMPPFIVTLTTMMFFSGLAIWATRSRPIDNLPAAFMPSAEGRAGSC